MNDSLNYGIHGLVNVIVDRSVSEQLKKSIDFQISFFRRDDAPLSSAKRIVVLPYSKMNGAVSRRASSFHRSRGDAGDCLDLAAIEAGIRKESWGYTLFLSNNAILLVLALQWLLVEHGACLIHAAAVANPKGEVYLFPGPGRVGKCAVVGELVHRGWRVLGDDLVALTAQGDALAIPRHLVLKDYHRELFAEAFANRPTPEPSRPSFRWQALRFVYRNAPLMGVAQASLRALGLYDRIATYFTPVGDDSPDEPNTVPIDEIFGRDCILQRGTIAAVFFLERFGGDDFEIEPIDAQRISQRSFAIIHHEWATLNRAVHHIAALEIVDLAAYYAKAQALLSAALEGKSSHLVRIPENATSAELFSFLSHHIAV